MASIPTNNLEGPSNLATAGTSNPTTVSSLSSGSSNNSNGNGNNKRKHSLLGGEAGCQPGGNRRARLIRKCTVLSSKRTIIRRGSKKTVASIKRSAAVAAAVRHPDTGNTSDVDEQEVNRVNDGNNCSMSSSSSAAQNNADAMIDDIAAMNEIGIANLYAGDALVAKESFITALCRCSLLKNAAAHHAAPVSNPLVPGCNNIMSSSFQGDDQKKMSATPPAATTSSSSSTGTPHPPVSSASTASSATTSTTIISTTTSTDVIDFNKPSNMHVYQREEYDEGMHVYNEALYLDKEASTCKPLRDATLMYNVGQTHLRTRQYQDAKRWFSLALATFGDVSCSNDCISCISTSTREEDDDDDDDEACTPAAGSMLHEVMIHHNIAFCYYCLGDNDQAMSHYQTAFRPLQELGLGDLDIAACCNSIGILHLCRGSLTDSAKAMECLQLSLSIYKRVLGHASTRVATCLSNIARVFFSRQEFPTALALFQEALKIRQAKRKGIAKVSQSKAYKDSSVSASVSTVARINPVDEAAAMFNIGQTYQKLGKVDLALGHFKSFRELAEPILGKGHRDIATCIKAMACIHYESGKIDTACELLEEAVEYSRRSGQDFPLELACLLRDMGCLYSMTNQTSKALASHMESLKVQRKLYDNDHKNPNIMVTLLHIAQSQKKLGNYTEALNVYRAVYAIQLDIFGPKSLEVAATLCSIGLMLYLKQDLQSSLNYYQEALLVRQDYFKTNNNFDIAATFNSIGLIAFKMNKLDVAKNAFQDCIRIRFNLEGTDSHRDIVTLYSNLGTVFLANGEDKEAIQMFSESIRLERKTLGEKHLGVAVSLQHLAQLHQDRGELELAHEYFAEALKITRDVDESLMANKDKTICTLLNLMGNIHLMKAEVPQMMECFTEASRICEQDFNSLVIAGYTFYGISKMHPPCAPEA